MSTPTPEVRVAWRPEQFNRVTNPGFETNTTGWSVSAGINAAATSVTRVTTDSRSGSACASVVCTSTDTSGVNFDMGSNRFYAEGDYGALYVAVVWLKRVSGSKRVKVILGSEGTSDDRATLTVTDLPDSWTPYVVRWLPTANRTDVQLAVTNGSAEAITFRIDDAAVYLLDGFTQVENGSFEVDTTGWAGDSGGSIARSTSEAFAGSACARITSGTTHLGGAGFVMGGRFIAGRTYRARVAMKSISGTTGWYIDMYDTATTEDHFTLHTVTTDWAVYTYDWTPNADCNNLGIYIIHSGTTNSVLAIDEVEVYEAHDELGTDAADLTWTRSLDSIGTATVEVLNTSGKYDPRYSSSALYGSVAPGRRLMIRSVYEEALRAHFYGTVTTVEPRPWDNVVDLVAEDMMGDFARGRFASSFIENVSYYRVRGRVIAAVLNHDPWLEDSTTGASHRARFLHGPEGNNFYVGTDDVSGALDVLEDMNEATGSIHYIQPDPHAMVGWKYTSKARTQVTDSASDFTIDEDFVNLSGVRYTHEALENYQRVPWQGYEMGPVPEDDTNGNGSGTIAQAIVLGQSYTDTQLDLDPYLHYTREEYGDNGDIPEPTYKVTKRRRQGDRKGDKKRGKGRRFVKKKQRIYPDAFVPFTIATGEVRRITFDFALPVSGPILHIDGPAGVTTITTTEVEKSPNRYVLDLSASADTVIDYVTVTGTAWTPLDEEEAVVSSGTDAIAGSFPGPGFSTPYIPSAGDAEGLGAYRNWRYGEARMRPTLELGVGQVATAVQLTPSHHITLSADRWRIDSVLFLVLGATWSVSDTGRDWRTTVELEELPAHDDFFVWDTNEWDDSSIWAY
jgi:hypothetical protein